jgi:hypothetical protein
LYVIFAVEDIREPSPHGKAAGIKVNAELVRAHAMKPVIFYPSFSGKRQIKAREGFVPGRAVMARIFERDAAFSGCHLCDFERPAFEVRDDAPVPVACKIA